MKKFKNAVVKQSDLKLGEIIEAKSIRDIPKLKDFPKDRGMVIVDCMEYFGFLPQFIVVNKVKGKSNAITISGMRKTKVDLKAGVKKLGGKDGN